MKFYLKANLSRRVDDAIELTIEATDEAEALEKAYEALNIYPAELQQAGVDKICTVSRHNHVPDLIDVWNARGGKFA